MDKHKTVDDLLERRRLLSYQRQKNTRDGLIHAKRHALMTEIEESIPQVIEGDNLEIIESTHFQGTQLSFKHHHIKPKRKHTPISSFSYLAKLLQVPDYMASLPSNLSQFLVYARPAGKRVLVILKDKDVIVVGKSGVLQTAFTSKYLCSNQKTILEGIVSEENNSKIYITDVIQWKGDYKAGQEAIFRYYWLTTNLPKAFKNNSEVGEELVQVEVYQLNRENLGFVYSQPLPYKKDGLLFIHQQSIYEHGNNPGVMYWKDPRVSEYCYGSTPLTAIGSIVDGFICSLDGQRLRKMDVSMAEQINEYRQVKFCYERVLVSEVVESEGEIVVSLEGFQVVEGYTWQKYTPDCFSKILFYSRCRTHPLTVEEISSCLP